MSYFWKVYIFGKANKTKTQAWWTVSQHSKQMGNIWALVDDFIIVKRIQQFTYGRLDNSIRIHTTNKIVDIKQILTSNLTLVDTPSAPVIQNIDFRTQNISFLSKDFESSTSYLMVLKLCYWLPFSFMYSHSKCPS